MAAEALTEWPAGTADDRRRRGGTTLLALAAAVLAFLPMRAQVVAVWQSGAFFDTDDAMHMVQVRALLAGQPWFDMTVPGLNPPDGTFMHWSRLADLPTAALVRLFALVTDAAAAERWACLAYPFLLTAALFILMARLADCLLGPDARLPAMLATLLSGTGIMQFMPGRIDHHAPQVLILIAALTATLRALDDDAGDRSMQAVLPGVLTGLSLAINLEDLPFLAVLPAGLVALWIWRGEPMRRALGWYGGGLALGLPLFYAATVAPGRYGEVVCDAFGATHLGAGLIAAGGLLTLALASLRLTTPWQRAAAALAIAAAALAFVGLATPACLGSPFAAVDPLVRELWLAQVDESLPLAALLRRDPATALASCLPAALGLAGCLAAACRGPRPRRIRFAFVAAVAAAGLALAFWQVRVLSTVGAVAACGGVHVAFAARRYWRRRGREALASASLALLFPFSAAAASLIVPAEAATQRGAGRQDPTLEQCLAPAAFAPFRDWTGTVIAPVDAGSYLLVHTRLSVFAAAFHRDNDGNRFHFDVMLAAPDDAERLVRRRGADLIMTCDGLPETRFLADRAPTSLAAAVRAGRVPDWLTPVVAAGTPVRMFRVKPRG